MVGTDAFASAPAMGQEERRLGIDPLTHWKLVDDEILLDLWLSRRTNTLPEWKFMACLDLLCEEPPDCMGVGRLTEIHFVTPVAAVLPFWVFRVEEVSCRLSAP